ncbi:MAG: type II toxin-antitoxin system mRNA interferase toxin, RelE/StbE family [Candidatus Pacebacteria bacterium]|nr:type II toxin-antitoxin system mRNA interferase toxin, RelE/StbE family [Candidatus Paceibacterota bacterium]MBP9818680.1 type II toxin-antitoxin system mRNA interferase toxin, RelE/StbE family [Candidatus Paceibacterota bacterium]
MIDIIYAPGFIRRYKKLNPHLKDEVKEKIEQFRHEDNHKALKVHKLGGTLEDTFSFTVNYKIRIVFEYGKEKNTANLLLVGDHDGVY